MENDSAALHRLIMGILLMYQYILTICFFFQAFNQASYVGVGIGKKTNTNNQKNQVAVNIGQASEEDLKLHTFAQLAPPAAAGASENPSRHFVSPCILCLVLLQVPKCFGLVQIFCARQKDALHSVK